MGVADVNLAVQAVQTLELGAEGTYIDVSPNGTMFATGDDHCLVKLFDMRTRSPLGTSSSSTIRDAFVEKTMTWASSSDRRGALEEPVVGSVQPGRQAGDQRRRRRQHPDLEHFHDVTRGRWQRKRASKPLGRWVRYRLEVDGLSPSPCRNAWPSRCRPGDRHGLT